MVWAIVKIVEGKTVGCMVGPFPTEREAEDYAALVGLFGLGYENWIVRELQPPHPLNGFEG